MAPTPLVLIVWYFAGYFGIAAIAFLTTRKVFRRALHHRHIPGRPDLHQIRSELRAGLVSQVVYTLLTLFAAYVLMPRGWLRVYFSIDERGLGWYFGSYVVVLLLHDAYFYWTHRWMHHPRLFPIFHQLHHESVHPTPFTSHSFQLPEAIVQSVFFLLIAVLIPLHWTVFPFFFLFSMLINVHGHLGIDLLGRAKHSFPFNLMHGPCSHGWHHQHSQGNYANYFQLWDRIMGTWRGHLEPEPREKRARNR